MNRRTLVKGMMAAGTLSVGGMLTGRATAESPPEAPSLDEQPTLNVQAHGVRGDGQTHEADLLQRLLDKVAERGGGVVEMPPGRYILEKTLFLPSNVHVLGHGPNTVLEGDRPGDVNGFALVSNQGHATESGYGGASNFSLQNITIDSPRTNGIVLVHARNGYFSHIYGKDTFHHFFDMAGNKNIVTENLFLTGRSGTAPYQIDGTRFYNNTWDGQTNVEPYQDETENDGIFLSHSIIHPTNRPNHGIHFHRNGGRNIFIDNVLIEHCSNGIYRDPNTNRTDVHISNLVIKDMSQRGIHFRNTDTPDERVSLNNIVIRDISGDGLWHYQGCNDLTVSNIHAQAGEQTGTQRLLFLDVQRAMLDNLNVYGHGAGSVVWLRDSQHVLISKVLGRHVSRSLRLEGCANIQYSGICELTASGEPIELNIRGADQLTPWQQS